MYVVLSCRLVHFTRYFSTMQFIDTNIVAVKKQFKTNKTNQNKTKKKHPKKTTPIKKLKKNPNPTTFLIVHMYVEICIQVD